MRLKSGFLACTFCVILLAQTSLAVSETTILMDTPAYSAGSKWAKNFEFDRVVSGGPARTGRSNHSVEFGMIFDLGNRFWLDGRYSRSSSWAAGIWAQRLSSGNALLASSDNLPFGDVKLDIRPLDPGGDVGPGAALWAQIAAAQNTGEGKTIEVTAFSPAQPAGNSIAIYAVSSGNGAGAFLGAALSGTTQSASALGIIYDVNGFALVGIAGNDAIKRQFRMNDEMKSQKRSLHIGYSVGKVSGWDMSVKLGVNATQADRQISQHMRFSFAANAASGANAIPHIKYSITENTRWSYISADIGGSATRNLGQGWSVSVAVAIGAGTIKGNYSASRRVRIEGLADQRYWSSRQSFSRGAAHGKISLGISRMLGRHTTATLEVWAAGMSAVPVPVNSSRTRLASGAAQGIVQLNSAGGVREQRRTDWRPAMATGIRFGLRHHF